MNYTVREIQEQISWDNYYTHFAPDSFLHTWEWGEFQTDPIHRIGIYDETNTLQGIALLIHIQARRASYLLCPHGPLVDPEQKEALLALLDYIIAYGKKLKVDFIRLAPIFADVPGNRTQFSLRAFRPAPIHTHPELSWILNLAPDEATLLANMRKTTRYSIRKAEKDGVTIRESVEPKAVDEFWDLYQATVARQKFIPFSKNYLQRELKTFAQRDMIRIFLADYQGQVVSGAMIIFTEQEAFYHQGASMQVNSKLTASYLLQWNAIQYAKKRGCQKYNFWGISPDNAPHHPWAGLSLFKKGFGGQAYPYVPSQDLPLRRRYWLNWLIEKHRAKKRGY